MHEPLLWLEHSMQEVQHNMLHKNRNEDICDFFVATLKIELSAFVEEEVYVCKGIICTFPLFFAHAYPVGYAYYYVIRSMVIFIAML